MTVSNNDQCTLPKGLPGLRQPGLVKGPGHHNKRLHPLGLAGLSLEEGRGSILRLAHYPESQRSVQCGLGNQWVNCLLSHNITLPVWMESLPCSKTDRGVVVVHMEQMFTVVHQYLFCPGLGGGACHSALRHGQHTGSSQGWEHSQM